MTSKELQLLLVCLQKQCERDGTIFAPNRLEFCTVLDVSPKQLLELVNQTRTNLSKLHAETKIKEAEGAINER